MIHTCMSCHKSHDCGKEANCTDPVLLKCDACKPICTLTPEEMVGMKEAGKRNRLTEWRIAIMGKYNLRHLNFEVDNQGGVKYVT